MTLRWVAATFLVGSLAAFGVGCGDDTGGNGGGSGTGGGSTTGSTTDSTTTGSQTCDSSHTCLNDVCECTTTGKDGVSCTDDVACVDECEVCS